MSAPASTVWKWARPRLPEIVFLAFTTGIGLWAAGRWMDPVGDPGFSWSLAYRLSHGERLYRDVYLAYGPLSPYLLALWARLFGVSSLSMLLANWIPAIVAGLLLLRCAKRLQLFERVCLVGMILATSVFAPGPGRLVLPYYPGVVHALSFSLGALLLLEAVRPWRGAALLSGLLAGLAFCCKQEIGIAALAALVASTSAASDRPIRSALVVMAGFTIVFFVAGAFVLLSAPVESLRDHSHLWPLNPHPPAEFGPLYRSVSGLVDPNWFSLLRASIWRVLAGIGLLATLGGLLARERSRAAWSRLLLLGLGLALWWSVERFPLAAVASPIRLSVLVSFLVAILALAQPRLEGRRLLIGVGIFAGLAGLRAAFSPFSTGGYDGPAHFAAALSWAFLLFGFAPAILWPVARAAMLTRKAVAVVLFLIFWWDAAAGAESLRFPWKTEVATPQGRVYLERGQAAVLQAVGRSLSSGERVLVFPEIDAIDALFGVHSASPFLHHFPGLIDPKTERELINRFEKDLPSAVILFQRTTPEFGVAPFGKGFGLTIADWCFTNYRVVFSSPRGMVLKLREARDRASGTISSRTLPSDSRRPGTSVPTYSRGALAAPLGLSFWWEAGGMAALCYPWKETVSTPAGPVYLEFGQANLLRQMGRNVAAGDLRLRGDRGPPGEAVAPAVSR